MQSVIRHEPTISGAPLSVEQLTRLGILGQIAPAPQDFDPSGAWGHAYRIVTSHGYVESGNTDRGYLRIARSVDPVKGSFRLAVEQKIVQADGTVHAQSAAVRCAVNPVATPVEWTLKSWFLDLHGEEIPELTLDEDGRLPDYDSAPGAAPKRTGPPPALVTSDWCLFEAVQRLPFDSNAARRFDLLEGLSIARRAQRIAYSGKDSALPEIGPTHRFRQTGPGILPYDYWLDERRRLILVVTLSRAYVLDESAVSGFDQIVAKAREQLRQRGGDG